MKETAPSGAVSASGKVGFCLLQQPTRRALTHEQDTTPRARAGAHRHRIRPHRRRPSRRGRQAVEEGRPAVPRLRQDVRMLRRVPSRQALAGDGPRALQVLPGAQNPARGLPGPRRAGRVGAVGPARNSSASSGTPSAASAPASTQTWRPPVDAGGSTA